MNPNDDLFEIQYSGSTLKVQRHAIGSQTIFRIIFPGSHPALVITRAEHNEGHGFWTSIPEGRQRDAEMIGPIITEHFKNIS